MSESGLKETIQGCVYVGCHESYLHHTSWVMFFRRLISQLICFCLSLCISLLLPSIKSIIKSLSVGLTLSVCSESDLSLPEGFLVNLCLDLTKGFALSFTDQHRSHHLGKEWGTLCKLSNRVLQGIKWLTLTDPEDKHDQIMSKCCFSIHDGYSCTKPLPACLLFPANDYHNTHAHTHTLLLGQDIE